jgi:hypothetical protein
VELDGPPQARGAPGGVMGDRERIPDRMRQNLSLGRRAAAALALLALVAAGCGRNSGTVPADYAPGGSSGQDFLTVEMVRPDSASTQVLLTVYDHSGANGFGLYRRLPGQGFEDVRHDPFKFIGTLNGRVEGYQSIDHDWQPNRSVDYMARGSFNGVETSASPITNVATLPAAANPDSLLPTALVNLVCPPGPDAKGNPPKVPLNTALVWDPTPGAVRYGLEIVRSDSHLFFLGFTSPGTNSYQLGSGQGDVLHEDTLTPGSNFFWLVEAVDGGSRVIGGSFIREFKTPPADSLASYPPLCTP